MKLTAPIIRTTLAIPILICLSQAGTGAAQTQSLPEHVAALKQSLAQSRASLKQYEWIQTTVVNLEGEEKSRVMERCYYGADGGVQKVPLTPPTPEAKKRGLRGRIAAEKKEELTDYMKQAVALVKSYVPPRAVQIQAAKDAGKVSVDIVQPGQRIRLNFRDYAKPGDLLAIEVDVTTNRLLALKVQTYLEDAKDAVTLDVHFATLDDGTTYSQSTTLDAQAKKVNVSVDNSGYRKAGT